MWKKKHLFERKKQRDEGGRRGLLMEKGTVSAMEGGHFSRRKSKRTSE